MPEIEWDKEGNTIYIDDDGQRQTLVGKVGPGMIEKHNRLRELEEQKKELDEKLITISKEQGQIIRSLATEIEQELQKGLQKGPQKDPQKDPMDMTLDELYDAYLESVLKADLKPDRKAGLKLNRKETEETENRNKHQKDQISKKIDIAENMLKALNLCVRCNVRSRVNQWAKYCHAPCTPEREMPKEPSPPRLAAPPTVRQMLHMFEAKRNAEE